MEVSIQQVAALAGTTSRTLRHYQAVGLLTPSRIGVNGYRWYDQAALVRLQRILLLRELGLGLDQIRDLLDRQTDEEQALVRHLGWLRTERERLDRQVASVERTLTARRTGAELMAQDMLDGFDHTQYREEVEQRWGRDAYAAGDAWWRGMSPADRTAWLEAAAALGRDWGEAARSGLDPADPRAQDLAARHVAWLASIPGTPGHGASPVAEYVLGLGEMYVTDERFARGYGGEPGARFVRDALRVWVERNL